MLIYFVSSVIQVIPSVQNLKVSSIIDKKINGFYVLQKTVVTTVSTDQGQKNKNICKIDIHVCNFRFWAYLGVYWFY